MPLVPSRLKPISAAKHRSRATTRYAFEVNQIRLLSGLPTTVQATGLMIQMSRGAKLTTTKEVEITPEAKASGGGISFGAQRLTFIATCAHAPFGMPRPLQYASAMQDTRS